MTRAEQIDAFLANSGFAHATRDPLPADASFRRYVRLGHGPYAALLMDAPPPNEVATFARLAFHLRAHGIRVPAIYARNDALGLLLIDDLGHTMLADRIAAEPALLTSAAYLLSMLQAVPVRDDMPRWDAHAMAAATLGPMFEWWWPAAFGAPAPADARRDIADALGETLAPLDDGPQGFVHRDYFAGNLMLTDAGIAVIDFQSAAVGHPAYDLLSLTEDARRDISERHAAAAVDAYIAARPDLDLFGIREGLAICAAQRHLRVACQWVRLALRDGRPQYLAHGPRTWALLARALGRPEAAPLAAALDRHVPLELRANPVKLARVA